MAIRRSRRSSLTKRKKAQRESCFRRQLGRQLVHETLEQRVLLAIGPELFAVRPNDGELFEHDEVNLLNVAPREFNLLFKGGADLDPDTLDGIRVTRSNGDEKLVRVDRDRPFVGLASTDFNTAGAVTVEFRAVDTVDQGLSLVFTKSDHASDVPAPAFDVDGSTITVDLNTQASFKTTAKDLVDAINTDDTIRSLINAEVTSGDENEPIADPAINYSPVDLVDNDVVITPGFIGLGGTSNEVIVRFAETLPDDLYRIEVFGFDNTDLGITSLRSVTDNDGDGQGDAFEPFLEGTDRDTVDFQLDLGAQIIAVVPQPVDRLANDDLSQRENEIHVFFNDDDLHDAAVNTTGAPTDPTVVQPDF
ncbi:MAG: hypothetical protein H8E44_27335, partial [Planctomycetes bacterium]|nr:hypothetical protein [Planctomycetota bacterium]